MKAFAVSTLCCFVMASADAAHARPLYMRGFADEYPKIEPLARIAKCAVCHCAESKTKANGYGEAVAKALGAKNVKDREAISKALIEAETAPSSVPGKTCGDLIRDGKLPAPCPEKKARGGRS
ncbi:MAG: hypothetical protein H0T47_08220 [Planctomycetaceae bacterium]|nr:hypothetical protein [Planctomycetaceae bacterium]